MGGVEIGLSGHLFRQFTKAQDLGARLSEWVLLPNIKELGISRSEIAAAVTRCIGLMAQGPQEWAKEVRQALLSQVREFDDGIGVMAEKVPHTLPMRFVTKEERASYRNTPAERRAYIIALFSSLAAYLSYVETDGVEVANAYSRLILGDLVQHLPAHITQMADFAAMMSTLQQEKPDKFIARLGQYSGNAILCLPTFGQLGPNEFPQALDAVFRRYSESAENASTEAIRTEHYVIVGNTNKRGQSGPNLHNAEYYLETLLICLLVGRLDFITNAINRTLAQEAGVAMMRGNYGKLGGDQWIPESLAQRYLDQKALSLVKVPLTDGKAHRAVRENLNALYALMEEYKKESVKELKKTEVLHKLAQPASLDEEIVNEDGEIATLADMMPASSDLEEALPLLYECLENFQSEDRDLFVEHFLSGKSIEEIAIERGWEYDRTQKRLWLLHKQLEELLTKTDF